MSIQRCFANDLFVIKASSVSPTSLGISSSGDEMKKGSFIIIAMRASMGKRILPRIGLYTNHVLPLVCSK